MPFGLPMPHCRELLTEMDPAVPVGEALRCNVLTIETWGGEVRREFDTEAQRDPDCYEWNLKFKRLQDQRATFL
jgi:hypothetical protein